MKLDGQNKYKLQLIQCVLMKSAQCGNFSIIVIQILHEINSKDYRSSKTATLTILRALNFDFLLYLCNFCEFEIDLKLKFRACKNAKMKELLKRPLENLKKLQLGHLADFEQVFL